MLNVFSSILYKITDSFFKTKDCYHTSIMFINFFHKFAYTVDDHFSLTEVSHKSQLVQKLVKVFIPSLIYQNQHALL